MSAAADLPNIHAGLVAVRGRGVLIRGPARSGKSALALCLMRAAAREGALASLVADDRVVLARRGEDLVGSAPATLAGLLEVSGVGVLRCPALDSATIDLVADLEVEPERLPAEPAVMLLGAAVRRIAVPVCQASFGAEMILMLLDPAVTLLADDAMHN